MSQKEAELLETLKVALIDLSAYVGGGQIALCNLAYALSKRGHEVHIVLGMKNRPRHFVELCFPNCDLHYSSGYSNLFQLQKIMGETRRYISNLHKTHRFDVVNAQGLNGILISSQLQEHLVTTIHGNSIKRGLNLLQFACKNLEMRTAISKASKNFFENVLGAGLYGKLDKMACYKAKLVVTLTPTEAYYAQKYYSIPREKIRVIPNAVVNLKDNGPEVVCIPEEEKVMLSVGALEFIKGTPILVKAMRYVLASTQDVTYISVGNGSLMSNVRELKAEFPDKVIILPQMSDGLFSLYARSEALIHGSIYEAFGLSIAEAQLAGKPVIAFRLASIPDLVIDNVTGVLAEPGCARDLAIKTLSLIKDEEKIRNIGFNARKLAEKLWNVEVVGRRMERVLKEV